LLSDRNLGIGFSSDVRSTLPLPLGVTLFRVLQQALQNAVKHSGVKRMDVELREDSGAMGRSGGWHLI